MRISHSALSSYSRCPQQSLLYRKLRHGELEQQPESLSRTAYGSVLHHALHVMERRHAQGEDDPLGAAKASFEYYWNPEHIAVICQPVTIWVARDTYSGMLRTGLAILDVYWVRLSKAKEKVLGLEVPFEFPRVINGQEHILNGFIDKLTLKRDQGGPVLVCEDFKSGYEQRGLRWNSQFSIYALATTMPVFWEQWPDGEELFARFENLRRRGTWVSLRGGVKYTDAGFRGPRDFQRLDLAIAEYVRAVEAEIYPLNLSGTFCEWCQFRETCGGVAIPAEDYGRDGVNVDA